MKKIMFWLSLATLLLLCVTTASGEDYKIITGATYSWPRLHKANADIHAVEAELKTMAPAVKNFEDWDDVYTGAAGIGIQKKFSFIEKTFWAGIYGSYAKGPVKTSQTALDTVLGVPMDYSFKQEYEFYGLEGSLSMEVFKVKTLTGLIGVGVSYNHFESDTTLKTYIPAMMTSRKVKGEFKDNDLGAAVFAGIEWMFAEKWGVNLSARYDWLTFHDQVTMQDTTSSPLGSSTTSFVNSSVVDSTGPSLGAYLVYKF